MGENSAILKFLLTIFLNNVKILMSNKKGDVFMLNKSLDMEFVALCYSMDLLLGEGNLIDSYCGEIPSFYKNITIKELKERLIDLKNKVVSEVEDVAPLFEKTYIVSHITALLMQLDLLENNNETEFNVALDSLYDIKSVPPDINKIKEIHKKLEELLALKGYNNGNLREQVLAWKTKNSVSTVDFVDFLKKAENKYKDITFDMLKNYISEDIQKIYDSSSLEIKLVDTNQGWGAYNNYLGNYNGRISFNSKAKFNIHSVATFLSHEGFPGHHTSALTKEFLFNNGEIANYSTLNLLKTPSSLIEEGIGDCGLKILGISPININERIEQCLDDLSAEVDYLLSKMIYEKENSLDTLYDILLNYKFMNDKNDAERSLSFIKNWTLYVPIYKFGREFVSDFLNNNPKESIKYLYYPTTANILTGLDKR